MSMNLFSNPLLTITVQARTHRRNRINKKWRKQYGYKQVPDPSVYRIGGSLYAHPETIKRIERTLEKSNAK